MYKLNPLKVLSSSQKILYLFSSLLVLLGILGCILCKNYNFNIALSPYPCISNKLLHIYCPGCGGTRALKALLNLSFWESFKSNPIVLYVFILFLYYYIGTTIYILSNGKFNIVVYKSSMIYIAVFILLTNFILRNVLAIFFNIDYLGDISQFWNSTSKY